MIEILKQITGSQDLLHFIGSKGKCGYKLYPRWLQRRGWVFEEPTGMLTETEENFQPFKVLQGANQAIFPPLPETAQILDFDLVHIPDPDPFTEREKFILQQDSIFFDGRHRQMPDSAIRSK
jgi:hypothetical protein